MRQQALGLQQTQLSCSKLHCKILPVARGQAHYARPLALRAGFSVFKEQRVLL